MDAGGPGAVLNALFQPYVFTPEKGDAHHLGLCRGDSGSQVNHEFWILYLLHSLHITDLSLPS